MLDEHTRIAVLIVPSCETRNVQWIASLDILLLNFARIFLRRMMLLMVGQKLWYLTSSVLVSAFDDERNDDGLQELQ